jgi:hypothetical protein
MFNVLEIFNISIHLKP